MLAWSTGLGPVFVDVVTKVDDEVDVSPSCVGRLHSRSASPGRKKANFSCSTCSSSPACAGAPDR